MTWFEDHYPEKNLEDWAAEMPTTSDADTYLESRGRTDWVDSTDDDAKEASRQRAWDYLSGLDWLDDVFETELPDRVKKAHMVAMYYEFKYPDSLQQIQTPDDFLLSKNVAGTITKTYRAGAPSKKRFPELDSILKPFLRAGGSQCCVELGRG